MFGKILGIELENVTLINNYKRAELSLINIHVVFDKDNFKQVGYISNINEDYIYVRLIGEIKNNRFFQGITKYPSLDSTCRIISKNELALILGNQDYNKKDTLLIGSSEVYSDFKVTVNKDSFFAFHFAFLGNTGSGKSCGFARLLQNLFYYNEMDIPEKARFVVFDTFGDYHSAFEGLSNIEGIKCRHLNCDYSTNLQNDENLQIPTYFLDVDDLALLLDVHEPELLPIISSTLRITYIFTSMDADVSKYQNSIIASSLLDILASGKTSTQIRDQLVAVLSKYNTKDLNLESIISQPGYNRTLKQCLLIDNQGKINAMDLVVNFLTTFVQSDLENINITPGFVYTLDDVYKALEFSLINEGILSSHDEMFDKLNRLKVRLRSIITSDFKKVFEVDKVITKQEFVDSFFKVNGENAQVIDISFGDLEERNIKILTKIICKILYSYVTTIVNRGDFLVHIVIEEAHRFVQNDTDIAVIGYNIFERITKEGRKYGLLLGLITQRPSELSKTVLSQCGNFFIFKMQHPDDIDIVTSISTNINDSLKEKIKTLHPGMAVCFGNSFNIPLITQFALPDPMPKSENVKVSTAWY